MVAVIAKFRKDIGNPSTSELSDDDLQAILDARRFGASALLLTADKVLSGSPVVFRGPGVWETDAVLADSAGGALVPDATLSDEINGIWVFTSAPAGDVYVTGAYFDYWGAATDALEGRAAGVAMQFDFVTDGQQFERSQKVANLLRVAREYSRRSYVGGARGAY